MTEGSVTLNADLTFTHSDRPGYERRIGHERLVPEQGTYILNGTELRFLFLPTEGPVEPGRGYEEFGSISGKRLAMLSNGITFVFER